MKEPGARVEGSVLHQRGVACSLIKGTGPWGFRFCLRKDEMTHIEKQNKAKTVVRAGSENRVASMPQCWEVEREE